MKVVDDFNWKYRFLSNFYDWPVTFENIDYPTNEHAYQAAKTPNPSFRRYIAAAIEPAEAKRRGRAGQLREGWDIHLRYTVMEKLLELKFATDGPLTVRLLDTGDAVLIEGNRWHDNLWGDCRCGRAACARPGMNLLGWMLMRRRSVLTEALP